MNPDSSSGIYVTASVEAQCRMIAENQKIKEEENIKNSKVNALKRAARMNLRAMSFAKLVAYLPNDIMASEDPSTPLLQVLLSLLTDIIKDSYQHLGGKMGELSDLKKRTVAEVSSEAIMYFGRLAASFVYDVARRFIRAALFRAFTFEFLIFSSSLIFLFSAIILH